MINIYVNGYKFYAVDMYIDKNMVSMEIYEKYIVLTIKGGGANGSFGYRPELINSVKADNSLITIEGKDYCGKIMEFFDDGNRYRFIFKVDKRDILHECVICLKKTVYEDKCLFCGFEYDGKLVEYRREIIRKYEETKMELKKKKNKKIKKGKRSFCRYCGTKLYKEVEIINE